MYGKTLKKWNFSFFEVRYVMHFSYICKIINEMKENNEQIFANVK